MSDHALVLGKFYPPHVGHHALIRLAASECALVTVVVVGASVESIGLAERVEWLASEHSTDPGVRVAGVRCDAPVDLSDELVWNAQIAAAVSAVRVSGREPVSVVYSAEDYGGSLAARLGARHRRVARTESSSTAVRVSLADAWDMLAPATKAGLATRAVFVGAESTGTTSVSHGVASAFRRRDGVWAETGWVPEYGREFTSIKWERCVEAALVAGAPAPLLDEIVWSAADFDEVALEQTSRENAAARIGSPLLVCDTDAFATTVWERRYLGSASRTGQAWSCAPELPQHDVYFVTSHEDVPWEDDGLREGDLSIRAEMTSWFMDALTERGDSWVLLTGSLEERVDLAVRTIDQLLAVRSQFAVPLAGPGFEHAS